MPIKSKKRVAKKVVKRTKPKTRKTAAAKGATRKKVSKTMGARKRTVAPMTSETFGKAESLSLSPQLSLNLTSGKSMCLSDLKGKKVVLYFYPKDNTPGCTLEGRDFARLYESFRKQNVEVLGVSKDDITSHEKFKEKCEFPFELVADTDEKLCRAFDVIKMKNMYGRKFMGIERSTFVLDEHGHLQKAWRKVSVNGHADEVLQFVQQGK